MTLHTTSCSGDIQGPGTYFADGGVTSSELVLPTNYLTHIRDYLFRDATREYICQLLCGHSRSGSHLRVLGCYQVFPDADDYASHGLAHLKMKQSYDQALLEQCHGLEMSLIDIHSHPFSDNMAHFSGVDDDDEFYKFGYFSRNLPSSFYGSVVMSRSAASGRLFLPNGTDDTPNIIPLEIRTCDTPLLPATREAEPKGIPCHEVHDRQIRAFGRDGQTRLGKLRVGIVGLGGLGSIIAIGLARLGVSRFVLIDPDRAEPTNLNRLAGMSSIDAAVQPNKVDLSARRIHAITRSAEIERIPLDVFEPEAWKSLRDCDLLIASTDNNATRLFLNSLAQQYLLPILSVGTLITSENGLFGEGFGELFVKLPGDPMPCMLCAPVVDKVEAYYELTSEESRRAAAEQGYIQNFDEPDPAVCHLNGVLANLALIEIHNLVSGFKSLHQHLMYKLSEQEVLKFEHDPTSCAVCSPDGRTFARGDQQDPAGNLFPGVTTEPHGVGHPDWRQQETDV